MLWRSFLTALVLQGVFALPAPYHPLLKRGDATFRMKETKAFAPAADLTTSDQLISLKKAGTGARSSRALRTAIAPLLSADDAAAYSLDVNLGGKVYDLIFDTGSSDLWVAKQGFKCVNVNGTSEPQAACAFGPLFTGGYEDGKIPNENFNITYGDGEFITGTVGYEDVTVAGITVDKQEIALGTRAYWEGDNVTSGLMGFAYPALTSAFHGSNPATDNVNTTRAQYTDWVFNAIDEGKISSMFSIALERQTSGDAGQLALGGLPSISFDHSFTSTPIEIMELIPQANTASMYSFYTITPDGFVISQEEHTYYGYHEVTADPSTDFPMIVDSGTTLLYLPTQFAEEVLAAYDPPSVYIEDEGVYENYCDATPPKFAVRIGGTDFYVSSEDLLLQGELGYDPTTGGCVTGIQPSEGPYILGDVFLKNVVAVFDIGAKEMRFAPHENY